MSNNAPARQENPAAELRPLIQQMTPQFEIALPAHIPAERFARVIMTAVTADPDLAKADRASLFTACLQAANDGLLPDKKEGALIVYSVNAAKRGESPRWTKMVQWQPMWQGILKKVRNSGQLKELTPFVVYGGDHYRYWVDDAGEHVEYEPSDNPDKSAVRWVVVRAATKDGGVYIERMTAADVEKVRAASKAPNSPAWSGWWDQMAIKSVFRRLAKRLPLSTDLDDLIRRDDALYDFDAAKREARGMTGGSLASRMSAIAGKTADRATAAIEDKAGKTIEHNRAGSPADKGAGDDDRPSGNPPAPDPDNPTEGAMKEAADRGREAALNGLSTRALPKEYRDSEALANAWLDAHKAASAEADQGGEG